VRAVAFTQHSPDLAAYRLVETHLVPEPGPHEVLVQVRYAALNRLDDWVRRGWKGLDLEFPHIPCSDFSGTIAAIGSAVTGWTVGQAVAANPLIWCGRCRDCLRGDSNRCRRAHLLGENIGGTCAEYVVVPAINLVAIPAGYDMQQAAAASLVYVTAWHSLIAAGGLRAAERVLVVGAGGGVNTAAVQIACHAGCDVFVVAGNAEKARQAHEQGAGWTHDRSVDPNWSKAVYLATEKEGVDLVVDNVGEATWTHSLRTLRPGGRLVTVGGTTGYAAAVPVNLIFGRHLRIIGSTMGTQEDYLTVMELVFADKLRPIVDSVYPLTEFRAAMTRMLENRHFGKILIDVTAS
jgi:NADPH:quinone reductase-like Zn-dependent oxidoreductase